LRAQGQRVQVRTNLTVLFEPGQETMPEFFAGHKVKLVASLPCYLEANVEKQRGTGSFMKSIEAIKILNALGYGHEHDLTLDPGYRYELVLTRDLVYNLLGPFLPPPQSALEADYKRELAQRYGIAFSRLMTITNMPIGRFLVDIRRQGKDVKYRQTLRDSYNA